MRTGFPRHESSSLREALWPHLVSNVSRRRWQRLVMRAVAVVHAMVLVMMSSPSGGVARGFAEVRGIVVRAVGS